MSDFKLPTEVSERYKHIKSTYPDKYVQYSLGYIKLSKLHVEKKLNTQFRGTVKNCNLDDIKTIINTAEKEVADMNLDNYKINVNIDWLNSILHVIYEETDDDAINRITNDLDKIENMILDENQKEYKKYLELKEKYEK
jgi:hypothetical protein